jgi:phosphoglycerate dehydrogenase-like enzyme
MRTILSLLSFSDELKNKITKHAPGFIIKEFLSANVPANELADAEIILGWRNTVASSLENAAKLRWIQVWLAGVDNMPLKKLDQHSIYLTTASGANAIAIAEQVLGYMLIFTRKLDIAMRNKAKRLWEMPKGLSELQDKIVAIIGAGHIGHEIAKYAKCFGMKTIGVRRTTKKGSDFDEIYLGNALEDAVKTADFVVNCLPLTENTHYMINTDTFCAMKRDAIYISVGRGKTTDNDALLNALKMKEIAGAALDVYDTEPLPEDSPLWEMDNVFITPHFAGQTNRYDERIIDIFIENLTPYLNGEKPTRNLVNYAEAY